MKALLALSTALLSLSTVAASAETLTISWWGYNGDKLDANIIQPFKEKCGCDIVFETGNNADRLNKLQARGGKGIDVIFLTDSYSQIGIDAGIFQKLDRSKLPNVEKLYPLAQDPQNGYGPAYSVGRIGIVYDSAQVDPITSWDDLWSPDLKNQLSLPDITTTAGPMVVVKAGQHAGVDAFEDPDAAFDAVAELKPNSVKNYMTGSELQNLISTGEVAVSLAQDFTLASMQEAVPTVKWADLTDGDIATLNTVNIPTGAEHTELAYEFINFLLSTEVQQIEGAQGVDAPVNAEAELTPEEASRWVYGAEAVNKLDRMDYAKINQSKQDWIERWNEIFGM